jgi:PAS domain S-box-containing protein
VLGSDPVLGWDAHCRLRTQASDTFPTRRQWRPPASGVIMTSEGYEGPAWNGAGDETGGWAAPPIQGLVRFWELSLVLLGVGDYDGNYQHVNRAYQDVLGWSGAELMSVPWWEFLHPDERDDLADAAQQLMTHGQARFGDTVRMLCRDGRYKWIRWNTAIDPHRQLFYSTGIDLSDTRHCADRAEVGTWEWHPASNTLTCSPELVDLACMPAKRSIGCQDLLERVHPEDRGRVELRAQDSRITGERFTEDFRVIRPDHTARWLHAAGRADPDHAAPRLRGIALDITDRKIPDHL